MNTLKWGALLSALIALEGCDSTSAPLAGTNNETHSKGTLFHADGTPAVGARVSIFPVSQKPGDTLPVAQARVDANGEFKVNLKAGRYSLLAQDSSNRALFLDSLLSNGDSLMVPPDTLRPTGTITGHVRVQPLHSPAIAWLHVMRTDIFANVDSNGYFQIQGVPSGRVQIAAATMNTDYTTTFRSARVASDSSTDIGTIDLVYNGLPLVTGVSATYDTLTGVVQVDWHDTSYARKADYVVVRAFGQNAPTRDMIGSTASAKFLDTVFGGFGSARSRYDSTELDLCYWVRARSHASIDTAEGLGPIWHKASIHVKSPALAKRWNVEWESATPLPRPITSDLEALDTLKTGLAILSLAYEPASQKNFRSLQILGSSGTWSTATFPVDGSAPAFWKGRIWRVVGHPTKRGIADSIWTYDDATQTSKAKPADLVPFFDSATIHSSEDGSNWDSVRIQIAEDSVTALDLRPTVDGIHVVGSLSYYKSVPGMSIRIPRVQMDSKDGSAWTEALAPNAAIENAASMTTSFPEWDAKLASGPDRNWTILYNSNYGSGSHGYFDLVPGLSIAPAGSVLHTEATLRLRDAGRILAIAADSHLGLAVPESPDFWQTITTPEPVRDFCFWHGKLVVVGDNSLKLATIQ